MNKPYIAILIVIIVLLAWFSARILDYNASPHANPTTSATPAGTSTPSLSAEPSKPEVLDLIKVTSPQPGAHITSPLKITGQARGNWFFEASFPVLLTNWDGLIIAEGIATAQGEWMTTEFVPFEASLIFTKPACAANADYCRRGALILKKDNASGLPEHDAALEMTVFFD